MHIILKYIANSGLIRHALQEKFCVGIKNGKKSASDNTGKQSTQVSCTTGFTVYRLIDIKTISFVSLHGTSI